MKATTQRPRPRLWLNECIRCGHGDIEQEPGSLVATCIQCGASYRVVRKPVKGMRGGPR